MEPLALTVALILAGVSGFGAAAIAKREVAVTLSLLMMTIAIIVVAASAKENDRMALFGGLVASFVVTFLGGLIVSSTRKNRHKR